MSVDYYTCQNCHDTFPDCCDYFCCSGCESMFCTNECGGRELIKKAYTEDDRWHEDQTTCIFCRVEKVADEDLLAFMLVRAGISKEEATKQYIEANKP